MYLTRSNILIIFIIIALTMVGVGVYASHTHHHPKGINRRTVEHFELSRYLGLWYEIARFDNRFERNLECVTALYTPTDNGTIGVLNRGFNSVEMEWRSSQGRAKTTKQRGKLRVSFFWWFYSDYNILEVGDGDTPNAPYEWALVGSKSNSYLWILSRKRGISPTTLNYILERASARGYNTNDLLFIDTGR